MGFDKIKVANPIVEMDGDEMTRVIWQMIKDKHLKKCSSFSHLLCWTSSILRVQKLLFKYNVAIKRATITPDEARMKESNLKNTWRSPNGTIRNILNGWKWPICIGRHAFGDQYQPTDAVIKGAGKLKLVFVPEGGGEKTEMEVYDFNGAGGVALAITQMSPSVLLLKLLWQLLLRRNGRFILARRTLFLRNMMEDSMIYFKKFMSPSGSQSTRLQV